MLTGDALGREMVKHLGGKAEKLALPPKPAQDPNVELIYSRLSHPNAEILEDHLVPLEAGASSAAVFNSGMAAISTLPYLIPC